MKILYIGEPQTHEKYLRGIVPSHWLYGACEMERDGHEVIWEKECPAWGNDMALIRKHLPDMVFIPNLNLRLHLLLLLLASLGICRLPIYAYLHHGPVGGGTSRSWLRKFLLRGVRHLFFLSERSMQEAVEAGWVNAGRCSLPGWGADREFFQHIPVEEGEYFVSTGKENRDFDILIEAFRRSGAPLKILTASAHAGNDHGNLIDKVKDIPNITVCLTENTGDAYPQLLRDMAGAKALVCPLRRDRLTYCVGLSTIADAEGLAKPLLITRNPYHEKERTAAFHVVESVEDWVSAIHRAGEGKVEPVRANECSMKQAYERMGRVMFAAQKK